MRRFLALSLVIGLMAAQSVVASAMQHSSVRFSQPLVAGHSDTVVVTAVSTSGRPVSGAAVSMVLQIGAERWTFHLPPTNSAGQSRLTFHVPDASGRATVSVWVHKGALQLPVIRLQSTLKPASAPFEVQMRLPSPAVSAPDPVWLVVDAHDRAMRGLANAPVTATVQFQEGTLLLSGTTDSAGVLTLQIPTTSVRATQKVKVVMAVTWHGKTVHQTAYLTVQAPATASAPATATPTMVTMNVMASTATAAPTFTPAPTSTPWPTMTPTSTPLPTSTATMTPTPTATALPTATATATSTPAPTITPSPTSTAYSSPTPYPIATNTPSPTAVPTAVDCPGSDSACQQAVVDMINGERSKYGLDPLSFDPVQSAGTGTCVGSIGHSKAMAQSGQIWHVNSSYPTASFYNDICGQYFHAGENVGYWGSGNELTDLRNMHQEMMNELTQIGGVQSCPSIGYGDHACTILNPAYRTVGVGIVESGGDTWLTEDFKG